MAKEVVTSLSPSEALVTKIKDPVYISIPTNDEKLFIRAEKGKTPKLTTINLGKLATEGSKLAAIDIEIDQKEADRAKIESNLIDLARKHDGLSGVESKKEGFLVSIFPKITIDDYSPSALRRAFGSTYSTVVGEEVQAKVAVPLGRQTPNGPLTSAMVAGVFAKGLTTLGFTPEEAEKFVHTDLILEIPEGYIGEMITNKQVTIGPSVASVKEVWSATSKVIAKS